MTGVNYFAEVLVHLSAMIQDRARLGIFIDELNKIFNQYIEMGVSWEDTMIEIEFQLRGIARPNAFAAHFTEFQIALLRLKELKHTI